MLWLLKDVLDTEFTFGGVYEEQLIRVFRAIYPYESKLILPHTAVEVREQVDSLIDRCSPASTEVFSTAYGIKSHEGADVAGSRSTSTKAMVDPVYTMVPLVCTPDRTLSAFSQHLSSQESGCLPSAWSSFIHTLLNSG